MVAFTPRRNDSDMTLPSETIKKGPSRAGAPGMWKATGLTDGDLE